jgi:hypothetical protein
MHVQKSDLHVEDKKALYYSLTSAPTFELRKQNHLSFHPQEIPDSLTDQRL